MLFYLTMSIYVCSKLRIWKMLVFLSEIAQEQGHYGSWSVKGGSWNLIMHTTAHKMVTRVGEKRFSTCYVWRPCNLLVPVLMSMGTRVCSRARHEKDPTMNCQNSPHQPNLSLSAFASNHPEKKLKQYLSTSYLIWSSYQIRATI